MGYDQIASLKDVQTRRFLPDNSVQRVILSDPPTAETTKNGAPFVKLPIRVVAGKYTDFEFNQQVWCGTTISDASRAKQEARNAELVSKGKKPLPLKSAFDYSLPFFKEMVCSFLDETKDAEKINDFFKGCTNLEEIAQRLGSLVAKPTTIVAGKETSQGKPGPNGEPGRPFTNNTVKQWIPLDEQN